MASETAIDATLPPGAVFATRYEVVSLLGRGAMGAVYRVVDRELGETVALKVLDVLAKPFDLDGSMVRISASVGAALFPLHGEGGQDLLKRADQAMYAAKHAGKNRFHRADG